MVYKIIEIVGSSPKSFYAAVENAIEEAGKTVRGMKWADVTELTVKIENEKVAQFHAKVKIGFEVKR